MSAQQGSTSEMELNLNLSTREDGGSHVDAVMDVTINGKIAQFGSRVVQDVSNQLFKQFVATCQLIINEAAAMLNHVCVTGVS